MDPYVVNRFPKSVKKMYSDSYLAIYIVLTLLEVYVFVYISSFRFSIEIRIVGVK